MMNKTKEIWYDDCIALQRSGKTQEAVDELLLLTQEYPDYALAHLALAVFYSKLELFDACMEQMKTACELESDDPFYYTAFSSLAIKGGKHSEAEDALMKAQEKRMEAQLRRLKEQENNENN